MGAEADRPAATSTLSIVLDTGNLGSVPKHGIFLFRTEPCPAGFPRRFFPALSRKASIPIAPGKKTHRPGVGAKTFLQDNSFILNKEKSDERDGKKNLDNAYRQLLNFFRL
jgi:hypothetical protein